MTAKTVTANRDTKKRFTKVGAVGTTLYNRIEQVKKNSRLVSR